MYAFRIVCSYKLHLLQILCSTPTHHIHVRLHERELENGTASHPIADRRGLGWGRGGSGGTPLLRHIDSAQCICNFGTSCAFSRWFPGRASVINFSFVCYATDFILINLLTKTYGVNLISILHLTVMYLNIIFIIITSTSSVYLYVYIFNLIYSLSVFWIKIFEQYPYLTDTFFFLIAKSWPERTGKSKTSLGMG